MIKKRKKNSFLNNRNSTKGRISTLIGIISIIIFIVDIIISFNCKGDGGALIGYIGTLSFVAAIIGLIIGLLGFKEEKEQRYSYIGCGINLIICLIMGGMILAYI